MGYVTGLHRNTLRNIENGDNTPTLPTLMVIAAALEVKLAYLLKGVA